jgi:hypothetical protein
MCDRAVCHQQSDRIGADEPGNSFEFIQVEEVLTQLDAF